MSNSKNVIEISYKEMASIYMAIAEMDVKRKKFDDAVYAIKKSYKYLHGHIMKKHCQR
jgi:hypothetical protein